MSNDDDNGIASAIEAGEGLANVDNRWSLVEKESLDAGHIPVMCHRSGDEFGVAKEILAEYDARQPRPRRRQGTCGHLELSSFIDYVNRYKIPETIVWANPQGCEVTCVFDADPAVNGIDAFAGWGVFRAKYACPLSPEWTAWVESEDRLMSQDEFAEMIEDYSDFIQGHNKTFPTAVELLEMARNLRIHSKGTFERRIDPTTGQFAMVCKQEHETTSTTIHPKFRLGLRVFDGGVAYAIVANVKFKLNSNGCPLFSYSLQRREEVVRDAFKEVRTAVAEKTGVPVFVGTL